MRNLFFKITSDKLYQNSLYIMAGTFILAAFGFIFWIINAHIFSPDQVGIATTLLSSAVLIVEFSDLGFNISLIRYLPKSNNKSLLISSAFIIVSIFELFIGIIFLVSALSFTPQLEFLKTNPLYIISFLIFVVFLAWNNLIESIFKAYRAAKNILIKNIILSILKILFPFLLIFLGAYGIFSSIAIANFIAFSIAFLILIKKYNYQPKLSVNIPIVRSLAKFSAGNYLAGIFYQAPSLLLPLLIISKLEARYAAYYYIDSTIINILIIMPIAVTQTLLTEGSYDESKLEGHLKKAIVAIAVLLIPAILVTVFFGQSLLHIFGKSYASEAFFLLQLLSIATFFTAISLLAGAILRIKHQISTLIVINLVGSLIIIISCYYFLNRGLPGIGFGWLLSQIIVSILFLIVVIKKIERS